MRFEQTTNQIPGLPRRLVAAAAAAIAAVVASHALVAVAGALAGWSAVVPAAELTLAAIGTILVATIVPYRGRTTTAAVAGTAFALILQVEQPGTWGVFLALPAVGASVTFAAGRLANRLPASIDRALSERRVVALLWALLAMAAVVQTGRLATYMTDPTSDFVVGTRHPFWYGHQCLSAYLHGAELALWGEENIYRPEHYFEHASAPRTEVEGLVVEDPYQYPPQFLLLLIAALETTHDLTALRVGWFALNFALFVAAYALLALWIGGRPGRLALWLSPAVLTAFPVLYDLQYGQFHLAAVCLATLGMLAFATRRRVRGGLLLAAAILAKLFPLVLLVPLLVRRRFRELAWTAGWAAALTALTLAVVGTGPFVAFFDYHLPRLASGAAFAFDEAFPELADLVIADNQGVFGLAVKLGLSKSVAATIGRLFTLAVLAAAALVGLRFGGASRWARGSLWLALLGLASLSSPGAWGDYVPVTAVWLLPLLIPRAIDTPKLRLPLTVVAVFQYSLLGTMPIAGWSPPEVMIPLSAIGVATLLALFGSVVASRPRGWAATERSRADREIVSPSLERAA